MIHFLWLAFGCLMVGLIIRVRFFHNPDGFCEFCAKDIDTNRDYYLTETYAIDLGVARVYDYWLFCSTQCQDIHKKDN